MIKVLFVCMGNICRSPTAEGVFQQKVIDAGLQDRVHIDSAGTHAYHVGEPPDSRAQAAASNRGFDLSGLRARKVSPADFEEFDYVIAMDTSNAADLHAICPPGHEHKIKLFLEFGEKYDATEVPDPYYGGTTGFERVLDLIEDAADGLLSEIKA